MQSQSRNKQIVIISGIVLAAVIITALAFVTRGVSPSAPQAKDFSGNSGSGESTPGAPGPVLVGYDNLIANGVTLNQVDALQKAFSEYKPLSANGTVIDVSQGTLIPQAPDPHDPLYRPGIKTTVLVNQKTTYTIRFYFWDITKVQLLIYDSTGKTKLFDSGIVAGAS